MSDVDVALLVSERDALRAQNADLAAQLEVALDTAKQLHSRASVAEDSRSSVSTVSRLGVD